jgi:hypothetical protein
MSDQSPREARNEAKAEAAAAKARAKSMRPWYRKKRFLIPLALVAVIALATAAGGGGGDDDKKTATSSASSDEENSTTEEASDSGNESGEDEHRVGDTAKSSDFELTLLTVEDPMVPTNDFEKPSDGMRFVAVEVEAKNVSDERQTLSTLLGAEIIDSQNQSWDIAIAGTDRPQLDGEVMPGQSRRGWIAFEVPADATGLKLRLKGSMTAAGALFVL